MTRVDGWRLRVAHETRFEYEAPARASYNEVRMTPLGAWVTMESSSIVLVRYPSGNNAIAATVLSCGTGCAARSVWRSMGSR